jgi:hypothetical protein
VAGALRNFNLEKFSEKAHFMKTVFTFILCSAIAAPAFASVSVSRPMNGEQIASPFTLSASASSCSSQPISAMGYSFDSSTNTTVFDKSSIDTQVSTTQGTHTLHVKSWGDKGASCVTDVSITVSVATGDVSTSIVPSGAASNSSLQTLGWKQANDTGATGSSTGSMSLVGTPAHSGTARQFVTKYSNGGNERYYTSFSDDTAATNFLYDGWVYISGSTQSKLANLEMDLNQVMPNGQTVIFGFQCDGYNGTWDVTENAGSSPTKYVDHWIQSSAKCNPRSWSPNVWHHVQVEYSRTSTGVATYQAVWLDGVKSAINKTVNSAFALGWAPTIVSNFQVDGLGSSGSVTVYLDDLTVYRW